jgi:hypothetical protein
MHWTILPERKQKEKITLAYHLQFTYSTFLNEPLVALVPRKNSNGSLEKIRERMNGSGSLDMYKLYGEIFVIKGMRF